MSSKREINTPAMKEIESNPKGLHKKYLIRKIVGVNKNAFGNPTSYKTKAVDKDAEFFVLRLDEKGDPNHVRACRIAVNKYADEIESYLPELAKDLRERYTI